MGPPDTSNLSLPDPPAARRHEDQQEDEEGEAGAEAVSQKGMLPKKLEPACEPRRESEDQDCAAERRAPVGLRKDQDLSGSEEVEEEVAELFLGLQEVVGGGVQDAQPFPQGALLRPTLGLVEAQELLLSSSR